MSFPDQDPAPSRVSDEQMRNLLAISGVHPQSNFARNCMRGHFYLDAPDGKQYAVAAWFDQNREEESAATTSRVSLQHSGDDNGDLVARAMGLPMPSVPSSSTQQPGALDALMFATPEARRNFDLVVSAMRGDR